MAGLPCAKRIIDEGNAVIAAVHCAVGAVILAATRDSYPDPEDVEVFLRRATRLEAAAAALTAELDLEVADGTRNAG